MRNKFVAFVLARLVGGFGIHHFYLGNSTQGVLYLIFCRTFIPAIISFFEGLGLLLVSEDAFNKKYNK